MDELSIHDLIAIWRRRKVVYFVTLAVFLAIGLVFVFSWSRYKSIATVAIQQPDIPQNMTAPASQTAMNQAITLLVDQRIQQIEEKITSASNLVDIITKFNLYPDERRVSPIEKLVETMRKKIKLQMLTEADTSSSSSATRSSAILAPGSVQTIAFTLEYSYTDPLVTQQVTNELVSRFLDEDLKQRRAQSQSTAAFMGSQITALEATISEQEKKIEEFRAKHPESRPESLALNQQLAATTFQNLQQVEANLDAVEKNRGDLRTQIAGTEPYSRIIADGQLVTTPAVQLKALQAKYATMLAQYTADHPDVIKLRHQIEGLQNELGQTQDTADLQSQLKDARVNLAAAEQTYGPDHPDVLALRHQVASLEGQFAAISGDPTSHSAIKKDADNPAYLMMKQQLDSATAQYDSLLKQRDALRKQYDHYMELIATAPALEQEFAALSRDYDNAQLRYRELKEKKMSADMNEQMEQGRQAERLEVVDPPALPVDTSPKRLLLLAAVVVCSIGGGFGGIFAAELGSRSVHGSYHVTSLTGLVPLVIIPHIFTAAERRHRRRRQIQVGSATAIALVISIILLDQFVMPLDVLWSSVLRRFGIA